LYFEGQKSIGGPHVTLEPDVAETWSMIMAKLLITTFLHKPVNFFGLVYLVNSKVVQVLPSIHQDLA
jgi:hypothetical protein